MKKITAVILMAMGFVACNNKPTTTGYSGLADEMYIAKGDSIAADTIVYHPVRVDHNGNILPWYNANPGESYDYVLNRVWDFWKNMETDSNGLKYYMNHQVWSPEHDKRGLGGDQLMMALSSWDLYYNYTGDESLVENMKYMADTYLERSLSAPDSKWPDLPYPYNMVIHGKRYDGDMILGEGFLQPDKAGSFGYELVHLYKKTGDQKYLRAAKKIANTLAEKVQPGDNEHSPWPFKVHAVTGDTGILVDNEVWYEGMDKDLKKGNKPTRKSTYTTFFTGALGLFKELSDMQKEAPAYDRAYDIIINWLKNYPAKTNKWGPFFEDVPRWSDTQINAVTYAMYLLEHPEADPAWAASVNSILKWVHGELGNKQYAKYGVTVIDEQTAYRVPGNSHSSRQASVELMYWERTGDSSYVQNAVRMLNWATYMVDNDGKNFYPTNAIWMTDGYGDYARHYLRAMAAAPQLAPANGNHLLRTSSIVKEIKYEPSTVSYTTYDNHSSEVFRLVSKPKNITVNGKSLKEMSNLEAEGWLWQPLSKGGVLRLSKNGTEVVVSL